MDINVRLLDRHIIIFCHTQNQEEKKDNEITKNKDTHTHAEIKVNKKKSAIKVEEKKIA